ncbi:MAG: beta-ketoacyl synthase [Eudoraea sp.]|nr:beta-ketoacyl synthase [Eudoraea sp.]
MNQPISIRSIASVSPLGTSLDTIWENYLKEDHFLQKMDLDQKSIWGSKLNETDRNLILDLKESERKYQYLDDTVLYAMKAARIAIDRAGWKNENKIGINIGSSRGATAVFEKYHEEFMHRQPMSTLVSPTTTLGNISSWVAHDLKTKGPDISHSITCSTALHAILNGAAWLRSGMAQNFLVGGSEAPLTAFTLAQMQALKIYAREDDEYPCKALDLEKKANSMVLGEGASMACLELGVSPDTLAVIEGMGYATEPLEHNVSISTEATCFQESMTMAIGRLDTNEIDAIVLHAPGTVKGDTSEYRAIQRVFQNKIPLLTTNKWKIGHTFGASGMLSIEMAILMMQHQQFIPVPYLKKTTQATDINRVLVNAVGFGGNAVSILLKRPGI